MRFSAGSRHKKLKRCRRTSHVDAAHPRRKRRRRRRNRLSLYAGAVATQPLPPPPVTAPRWRSLRSRSCTVTTGEPVACAIAPVFVPGWCWRSSKIFSSASFAARVFECWRPPGFDRAWSKGSLEAPQHHSATTAASRRGSHRVLRTSAKTVLQAAQDSRPQLPSLPARRPLS